MAWTKNYNSQVGTAQALQGSADEKRRSEFWDAGLRQLQYKRDEFKEENQKLKNKLRNYQCEKCGSIMTKCWNCKHKNKS